MYVPPVARRPRPSRGRTLLLVAGAVAALLVTMALVAWAGASQDAEPRRVVAVQVFGEDRRQAVYAEVHIGDKGPFRFLVDTGASTTVIDPEVAAQLELRDSDAFAIVRGVGGTVQGAGIGRLKHWRIGDVRLPDLEVLVTDLPQFITSRPTDDRRDTAGLLGSDVLSTLGIVTIDFARGRLVTHDTPTGDVAPLVVTRGPNSVAVFVYARVHGQGPYLFHLDTGAEVSTIEPASAADLGLPDTGRRVSLVGLGGSRSGAEVTVDGWQVGDVALPPADIASVAYLNVTIALRSGGKDITPAGALGIDVLGSFSSISLDYAKERLFVVR
jgi:predicted aspartyl protease